MEIQHANPYYDDSYAVNSANLGPYGYLNDAVYLVEEFLRGTTDPPFDGVVDYGDRAEHCWNGDHTRPNAISRLRYHRMFAPKIVERILKTAPSGAEVRSWRY